MAAAASQQQCDGGCMRRCRLLTVSRICIFVKDGSPLQQKNFVLLGNAPQVISLEQSFLFCLPQIACLLLGELNTFLHCGFRSLGHQPLCIQSSEKQNMVGERERLFCVCGRLHCWFHWLNDDFFPAASHTKAHIEPLLVYILLSPGDTELRQTD